MDVAIVLPEEEEDEELVSITVSLLVIDGALGGAFLPFFLLLDMDLVGVLFVEFAGAFRFNLDSRSSVVGCVGVDTSCIAGWAGTDLCTVRGLILLAMEVTGKVR